MKMRDEIGVLYQDEEFRSLFAKDGQPALAPWRLALVTLMQFVEGLPDRQAAEAVRSRIDWKYALLLSMRVLQVLCGKGALYNGRASHHFCPHPRASSSLTASPGTTKRSSFLENLWHLVWH